MNCRHSALLVVVALVAAPAGLAGAEAARTDLLGQSYKQSVPGGEVSFEMVAIPGGTVRLGSPPNERGRKNDEGPQVEVRVDPFFMGKYEVTWPEYNLFLENYHRLAVLEAEKRPQVPQDRFADAVTYPTPFY